MIYTETEKKELDEVRMVFAEHLQQCPDYELLWSDKVGYVWLAIGPGAALCGYRPPDRVGGRPLPGVPGEHRNGHPISHRQRPRAGKPPHPLERAEIRRRWKPFMDQLPQFAYLCGEILPQKD